MPFSTTFLVSNVGISEIDLPIIFVFTGAASLFVMPMVGKISDEFGKAKIFAIGSFIASIMIVIYTHLSITPIWVVIVINIIFFAGIMSRAIPAMALMTAIPGVSDRGAFMSINSSIQQISGGIASVFAGMIVMQEKNGPLLHYDTLGYLCVATIIICVFMMWQIDKAVEQKIHEEHVTPMELH